MKSFRHLGESLLALCLLGMVIAVFGNVVLRYGFNSGLNASEELSRLLFVWMVFLGATLAYPAGQHMAFTSLVGLLRALGSDPRNHEQEPVIELERLPDPLAQVLRRQLRPRGARLRGERRQDAEPFHTAPPRRA